MRVGEQLNPRSLRNFPMQANGAEMLRIACCLATERGIEVCAPVHDAVLICAPLDRLEADIAATRAAMAEASRIVLAGFELNTDVKIVRWPDRYMDPRGVEMWNRVCGLVSEASQMQQELVGMSRKFVKFPKMWEVCLAERGADGSTYRVALYLLDRAILPSTCR